MSNELMKVEQMPLSEIMNIGKAFFESGMFPDIKGAAQAIVKIQAGQEMGIPPFASMAGIHIISGKPTVGAGLIAGRVKGSGKYDYKVVKIDDNSCILEFFEGKKSLGRSEFSKADAQKADTKNMGKFPKNMLFARAMSNGQKWFCPDVYHTPVYTPGEIDGDDRQPETTEDTTPLSVTTTTETSPVEAAPTAAPREELTFTHPSWAAVIDAITNKGYTLDGVERKYILGDAIRATLEGIIRLKASEKPASDLKPVTQNEIHNNNATYVAPTTAATDRPKRPF